MKREFKNGDIAYLTKGKRMKGFNLSEGDSVMILKGEKILDKHGGYLYTIEAVNPKTNEKIILDGWLTQNDLMSKNMYNKKIEQEELITKFEYQLKQKKF